MQPSPEKHSRVRRPHTTQPPQDGSGFQAMGGRSNEPIAAGMNPGRTVGGVKLAATLPTGSGRDVGSGTECRQAQWQLATSPNKHPPRSSAVARSISVSIGMVTTVTVVDASKRFSGVSTKQTAPPTSLISNTATASIHRPRWRRRRGSSEGGDSRIARSYTSIVMLDNSISCRSWLLLSSLRDQGLHHQHVPQLRPNCIGGQGTSPKEQNTQQSPGWGFNIAPQAGHSQKN